MVGDVVGTTRVVGPSILDARNDVISLTTLVEDVMVEEDPVFAQSLLTTEL